MQKVVKHFHLAFKGMETDEIYDVLMEQLIAAINGYDPCYKAKVKKVVEVINRELSKRKQFRVLDVRRRLEFDCDKHLRLLCRRGFLEVVPAGEAEKGSCFQCRAWPPPVEFTEGDGDVTGLAYYLQKWSTAWKAGMKPAPDFPLNPSANTEPIMPSWIKWFQPTAIIETITAQLFPPM